MSYPKWYRGMFPPDNCYWRIVECPYCGWEVYAHADCMKPHGCSAPPCDVDAPVQWVEEAPTAEEIAAEARRKRFVAAMLR